MTLVGKELKDKIKVAGEIQSLSLLDSRENKQNWSSAAVFPPLTTLVVCCLICFSS